MSRAPVPTVSRSLDISAKQGRSSSRSTDRVDGPTASPIPLMPIPPARAALSGAASVVPKLGDGRVEAIRALRVARSSAVKARTQATNQIKALNVTGPAQLREQLRHLPTGMIIAACARLRPWPQSRRCRTLRPRRAGSHVATSSYQKKSPRLNMSLINWSTRSLRRCLPFQALGPRSPARCSPVPVTTRTGSSPKPPLRTSAARRRSPPAADAFAGTDLIVAATEAPTTPSTSSFSAGSATTHALAPTLTHRTPEGLSKPEIIRCLKRYITRELYNALPTSIVENRSQQPVARP